MKLEGQYQFYYQVSINGPQPRDVVCNNIHHPDCVVLPTTLGNVPVVIPRYYCRGRSHDITFLYLTGTTADFVGYCFKSRKPVTLIYCSFLEARACVFIYIISYVYFVFFIIYISVVVVV